MIRKFLLSSLGALLLGLNQVASADTIELFDYEIISDGTSVALPAGLDASGLGTLVFIVTGVGAHSFDAFFDFEIDQLINTWFNEYGSTGGALAAGQSWEIDEPGYIFGDIFTNVGANSLDNSNAVPFLSADDVSFALGWDFTLVADEIATIVFSLGQVAPDAGFYLQHSDLDSPGSIFFSSTLSIEGGETQVPEPGTLWLLGAGLLGLGLSRRKRITTH
jgi:hypothetical protein